MSEQTQNIIEADNIDKLAALEKFLEKCNKNAGFDDEDMVTQSIVQAGTHTESKTKKARIDGATKENPVRITTDGDHGFAQDNKIVITRVRGMKELNGNAYLVHRISNTTFDLKTPAAASVNVNSRQLTDYTSGGSVIRVGDPLTISAAAKSNPVRVTTFEEHGFSTGDKVFIEGVRGMRRINGQFTVTRIAAKRFSLNGVNGSSYPRYRSGGTVRKVHSTAAIAIAGVSKANPASVTTSTDHNFSNGNIVYISGVGGMDELNGEYYTVAGKTARAFNLKTVAAQVSNVDGRNFRTYRSGGRATRARGKIAISTISKTATDVKVTTSVNHSLSNGDVVLIRGTRGLVRTGANTVFNNRHYTVKDKTDNTFNLDGITPAMVTGTHTNNTGTVRLKFVHWVPAAYLTDAKYVTATGAAKNTRLMAKHARTGASSARRIFKKSVRPVTDKYQPSGDEMMQSGSTQS